jgi:hypothetical protein
VFLLVRCAGFSLSPYGRYYHRSNPSRNRLAACLRVLTCKKVWVSALSEAIAFRKWQFSRLSVLASGGIFAPSPVRPPGPHRPNFSGRGPRARSGMPRPGGTEKLQGGRLIDMLATAWRIGMGQEHCNLLLGRGGWPKLVSPLLTLFPADSKPNLRCRPVRSPLLSCRDAPRKRRRYAQIWGGGLSCTQFFFWISNMRCGNGTEGGSGSDIRHICSPLGLLSLRSKATLWVPLCLWGGSSSPQE